MAIRSPTRSETTILRRAFDKWGVFEYFEDKDLLINCTRGAKLGCVSTKGLERIAPLEKVAYYGLEIGNLRKKFIPSIAGADLFVRFAGFNKKYCVSISGIGQELVLYGRDVMGDSVAYASEALDENEIVILTADNNYAIGV